MDRGNGGVALNELPYRVVRKLLPPNYRPLVGTPSVRRHMKLVRRNLEPLHMEPPTPRTRRILYSASSLMSNRRSGAIWAISMFKNENEMLPYVLDHLLDQGVDKLLVADNLSDDGTRELLHELARNRPLHVLDDSLVAYYQAEKMTLLAHMATAQGASWIVPFDADELWTAPGSTLAQKLRSTQAAVVQADIYEYIPDQTDPSSTEVPDPFRRIRWRTATPTEHKKVAFRAHPFARVHQGNHAVDRPGVMGGGLEVLHFPYRSIEQFIAKMRQGATAMSDTDLSDKSCAHWRNSTGLDDDEMRAMWDLWRTSRPLVEHPAPLLPDSICH